MSAPWMPLYVADYLADTRQLSTIEHGAYMLLIMEYWRKGGLPDDEKLLARITGLTESEWQTSSKTLAMLFQSGWKHKRIDAELAKSAEKTERRKEAGARGGKAKALNYNDSVSSNATILPEQKPSNALASSSQPQPHKEEITKVISTRGTRIADGWAPSSQDWNIAIAEIGSQLTYRELEKFRDYWIGKPGAGGRKSDWGSTWRNWVRKAADDQKARAGPRPARPSLDDAFATIDAMQNRGTHERDYHSGPTISLAALPFARGTG